MLSEMNLRDPVLINTVGHTAGLLLFAVVIALLMGDRRAHGIRQTKLSIAAAALALGWNIGSLAALAESGHDSLFAGIVITASFSVLSLLPAVLLQLALRGQWKAISAAGYAISSCAICLHLSELFTADSALHQLALILIVVGFACLIFIAFLVWWRNRASKPRESAEWFSLVCLLLFTSSFLHFGYHHVGTPWTAEITWHHLGIPVALVVLLRDYRFLLLDTFIRFLISSTLASGYVATVLLLNQRFQLLKQAQSSVFVAGLVLVGTCLALTVFAHTHNVLQRWIGRVIFRRQNLDDRIQSIVQLSSNARNEDDLLSTAARQVAVHLRTDQFCMVSDQGLVNGADHPAVLFGADRTQQLPNSLSWAEAQLPMRFSSGEVRFLLTGPRAGRQRYLSEDLDDMRRLGSAIVEQVERFRSEELKRLALQAELRALQAQINPHFLFNSLNTLYGCIDRESHDARRMVLNLADIFRYFLNGSRSFISLSEELRIIKAYLEIEALRLGDRLQTEMVVSESARSTMIPILSIQPLVENAVKHGISLKPGPGRVTLRAATGNGKLRVSVEDTGVGFVRSERHVSNGSGVGLHNVRRRLRLSYGPECDLKIHSDANGTIVTFEIPIAVEQPALDLEVQVAV